MTPGYIVAAFVALCVIDAVLYIIGVRRAYRRGWKHGAEDSNTIWRNKGHSENCAQFVVTERPNPTNPAPNWGGPDPDGYICMHPGCWKDHAHDGPHGLR